MIYNSIFIWLKLVRTQSSVKKEKKDRMQDR